MTPSLAPWSLFGLPITAHAPTVFSATHGIDLVALGLTLLRVPTCAQINAHFAAGLRTSAKARHRRAYPGGHA